MKTQMLVLAMMAVVGLCHSSALPQQESRIPPIWRKVLAMPQEQRATFLSGLLNPTTRSLLDDQVIAFINSLLAKPEVDPLHVAFIKINVSKDFAELHGNMDTVSLTGLSAMETNLIKINPLLLKLQFDFLLPLLGMSGNYDFNGVLASILPLYGKGPFELTVDNAKIAGSIQMGTNLQGHVFIKSLTLDLGLTGFHADFQMLMGSADLSDVVNEMINDLGMGFFTNFGASIETALSQMIVTWFNTTFEGYTISDIINIITGGGSGASVLSECKP